MKPAYAAFLFAPLALGACDPQSSDPVPPTEATSAQDASQATEEDALVEGTEYNATALIDCSFDGVEVTDGCTAGVVRNWGEDGTHLVEVTKPDGFKRALFFDGTTPTGADSAEADGSAGWEFEVGRDGDTSTIQFGPERYVVVDALLTGG